MLIELQCSNCGTRLSLNPTDFWKEEWRFTGVPYCPHCVETWKERNGKEWNEQYDEEQMKDEFYEYLFDKIEKKKVDGTKYAIYENKDNFSKSIESIKYDLDKIQNNLEDNFNDLYDCFISNLEEAREKNNYLIDEVIEDLESVICDLDEINDEIENLEIY